MKDYFPLHFLQKAASSSTLLTSNFLLNHASNSAIHSLNTIGNWVYYFSKMSLN